VKVGNEDLEEGELLDDDGEAEEDTTTTQEPETVEPIAPAVIPSLLDMHISPPPNGKEFLQSTVGL